MHVIFRFINLTKEIIILKYGIILSSHSIIQPNSYQQIDHVTLSANIYNLSIDIGVPHSGMLFTLIRSGSEWPFDQA